MECRRYSPHARGVDAQSAEAHRQRCAPGGNDSRNRAYDAVCQEPARALKQDRGRSPFSYRTDAYDRLTGHRTQNQTFQEQGGQDAFDFEPVRLDGASCQDSTGKPMRPSGLGEAQDREQIGRHLSPAYVRDAHVTIQDQRASTFSEGCNGLYHSSFAKSYNRQQPRSSKSDHSKARQRVVEACTGESFGQLQLMQQNLDNSYDSNSIRRGNGFYERIQEESQERLEHQR